MKTLGIDLSSQGDDTAVCLITWSGKRPPRVEPPLQGCDDAELHQHIAKADVIGIDAPFGWPLHFAAAVKQWTATTWTAEEPFRLSMRYRTTDLAVEAETDLWPLSVSSDRIALPAMRVMALLQHFGVRDKCGGDDFYEVYPAGSLKQWGLPHRGYKGKGRARGPAARRARVDILASLRQRLPGVSIPEEYVTTDHAFDALIAALTVRAAALGQTIPPTAAQRTAAKKEGWIHLPRKVSLALGVCLNPR